ncbi:MAG: hypothetical protein WC089_02195 [Candidatus Paceibacterota bacterium]
MSNTEITTNYAGQITKALLDSNSAGYDFANPKQWASGTYNPFYVDNRNLQSLPEIRKILRKGLASLINAEVDYVYGIPNAGIAPATLLALELNKPLLLKLNGLYYSIDLNYVKELVRNNSKEIVWGTEIIAGTTPFGTVCGIVAAEESDLPFVFIRKEPKGHGLNKQIEGIIKPGAFVTLMDPIVKEFDRYTEIAKTAIVESGMDPRYTWEIPLKIEKEAEGILGATIVSNEDLVSTGESMLKEITDLADEYSAKIIPISIFDYKLNSAVENFKKHGIENRSVVDFLEILKALGEKGMPDADERKIWTWYMDQPNWGDKNGFPAVRK